jgi:purine nucleosidase
MAKRVIFDTDPGVDDAMALLFLLRSPELELEAVTTVYGNVDVEQTTRNALIVLDIAGRADVPVARGADRPLLRERRRTGAIVHGDNGLGGIELPTPSRGPVDRRAAELIAERVMASPGQISLVAVGPLTNVALAARLEPLLAGNVREVVIMGGAATVPGNTTPLAEANIANDPEAASIVFHAGFPLAMVGLDVTHQVVMSPEYVEELGRSGTREGELIHAITGHYGSHYAARTGRPGFPVHDSSAVLYAIDLGYFRTERWFVDVETRSERAFGQTMADRRGQWEREPNANVCLDVDADRFLALYKERLTS